MGTLTGAIDQTIEESREGNGETHKKLVHVQSSCVGRC